MRRGDVFDVELDPIVGSEQGGRRLAVIVSRDSLNEQTNRVIIVPFTSNRPGREIFPNWVLVRSPEGGLSADSIALCEQIRVVSTERVFGQRGSLSSATLARLDNALRDTLGLGRKPTD